jgi:hypothetical protein
MNQTNIMKQTNHTLLRDDQPDLIPAPEGPAAAATTHSDDEIQRLAAALDRRVAWVDWRRQRRIEHRAQARRCRREEHEEHHHADPNEGEAL